MDCTNSTLKAYITTKIIVCVFISQKKKKTPTKIIIKKLFCI